MCQLITRLVNFHRKLISGIISPPVGDNASRVTRLPRLAQEMPTPTHNFSSSCVVEFIRKLSAASSSFSLAVIDITDPAKRLYLRRVR